MKINSLRIRKLCLLRPKEAWKIFPTIKRKRSTTIIACLQRVWLGKMGTHKKKYWVFLSVLHKATIFTHSTPSFSAVSFLAAWSWRSLKVTMKWHQRKKKRKNFSLKIQSRTSSKKSFYLFSRRSRNSRWTILTSFTLQIQFHNISNKRMPMPSRQLCYSWQSLALSHVTVQY